jgi:hypothetical protein
MAVRSDLRASRPLPAGRFLVLISVRRWVDPRDHSAAGWISSTEKSNDLIGNRTRDLPACSIVPSHKTLQMQYVMGNDHLQCLMENEVHILERILQKWVVCDTEDCYSSSSGCGALAGFYVNTEWTSVYVERLSASLELVSYGYLAISFIGFK